MRIFDANVTGSLQVSGSSNLKGGVTVSGSQTITGSLTVHGDAKLGDQLTDIHTVTGSLLAQGLISGSLTGTLRTDYIDINTGATITDEVARLKWNDTDGTLDIGLKGGNVVLQVGQEQLVRVVNKTNTNLLGSNYAAVRVDGAQGNRLKIALAQADNDANSAETLGLVTETINNNDEGFVTVGGLVRGINTSGALQSELWNDGDMLYLSPTTPGAITNVKPAAPDHMVIIGYVVRAHASVGSIFVKVNNGYEIDELHNVNINTGSLSYGDLLMNSASLWINTKTLSGSYQLTGSLDISGSQTINGNQIISGSITITQNINVLGTSSFTYITSSNLNLTGPFIYTNVYEPIERFGGLVVFDSGSLSHQATASLLWDSLNNHWIYQNASGSNYSGGMLLSGPRNTGSLGSEIGLTNTRIPKSVGGDHLDNSNIYDTGTVVRVVSNTEITGSLKVTGGIQGNIDFSYLQNVPSLVTGTGTTNYVTKFNGTGSITNSSIQDNGTGVGIGGAPVGGYAVYITSSINDGSLGIDSSANINAIYLLDSGVKKFEFSYDRAVGYNPIFRLLPYQASSMIEIGNPSNASNNNTDYVFIVEPTYGNVLIGPGLPNGAGIITGANAAIHKIQFSGATFSNSSIQATSFIKTGGLSTQFLMADGTVSTNPGWLTSHPAVSAASSSNNSGRTYIQDILLDSFGHITGITTATETVVDTYTTGATFNTGNGTVTFTKSDGGTYTVSLDGRYLTAHPAVTAASSSNNSGRTYIQDILLDSFGHITGITTATETVVDTNNYTTGATFNTGNGIITFTRNDGGTYTVDIDGRYLESESDTLATVTARGNTTNQAITVSGVTSYNDVVISGGTLTVYESVSGATVFAVDGTNGRLFAVTDDLSNSLFSVNTISGLPVIEAFADYHIVMGRFNQNDFYLGTTGEIGMGTAPVAGYKLAVVGHVRATSFVKSGGTSSQFLMADGTVSTNPGWVTANYYTTGATFNTSNGIITFTRNDANTYTVDIDGKYVNLVGDTMTGQLVISTTGTANSPSLRINTSSSSTFIHSQENFAPNMTSGQHNILVVGASGSTKNSGYIGYYWAGAGSNSNFVTIGHWGADDLFRVYGDGSVTIGTNTVWHAGNDGTGSGLDADLLDGQHGSYYYAASNPSGYISSYLNYYTTGGTFNTGNGNLTFTRNDGGTYTVNLDGRYQASGAYLTAESDTLATVTARGATTSVASSFSGGLTTTGFTNVSSAVLANNTGINPNSYPSQVVAGAVSDGSWGVTTGLGGNAGSNHNWSMGHNGSNFYFGISNGSSTTLSTWMQVSPSKVINLNGYTTNGFLKTSNSDGTLTVDTTTYYPSTNPSAYATTGYVQTQITNLVNSAPAVLDTLGELATALGNDANFSTTITTAIGNKVSKSGDTMTGNLAFNTSGLGLTWSMNTDGGFIKFVSTGDGAGASYLEIGTTDNSDEEIKFTQTGLLRAYIATDGFFKNGSGYKYLYESGSWGIDISGNAATVTNGVYTNGSYSNPSWITSLAGSKITGNISGNSANITAYTINQNLGTTDSPTFNNVTATGVYGTNTSSTRNKFNVYGNSGTYAIGMESGENFGGLADWAMTFQMNNDDDRGFWWGDDAHSTSQGAMALTTNGYLTVARGIRVGYGESDTATPTVPLQVYGSGSLVFDVQGSLGQLFSVTDTLSGSLFSVNDISGLPVLEVFSDDRVVMGSYGLNSFVVSGTTTTVSGSLLTSGSFAHIGTATINGGTVWHSSNDGHTSGLDADLLDGQHGSYYAAASSLGSYLPLAGGTMTGKISTVSTGTGTYDTAIEIREQGYVTTNQSAWGYSPAMTFHWGGRYGIRFGLRSDGLMAVDDAPIALRSWVTSQGYLTAHPAVSAASSSDNSGRTYIQDILLDSFGHITGITTATETVTDTNYYVTSASFNTGNGIITLTRNDGGTVTVDIDGRYKSVNGQTEVDVTAPAASSGSWNSATADEWGNPKFDTTYNKYSYADAPAWLEFNIPSGMKSAWLSQLTWSSGGYVDVHGVQSGGELVFLRRINTRQTVENTDEGVNHDGSTVTFVASGLDDYSKIRLTVQSGRFHLTGLAFSDSDNEGTEGVGMVHPAQISHQGSGSGLDADLLDGNHASAFYLATNPNGYITSSGSISGNAATATLASTVTINYNNDSNSTYQLLWGSGNSVYGTAQVYLNPSSDYVYAASFNANDWFRSSGNSGWYNSTHGGGIYQTESTMVRVYDNRGFWIDGGNTNTVQDATLYVTATNNNDWLAYFNMYNGSKTEYGVFVNAPNGATYGYALRTDGSSWTYRVDGSGRVYAPIYYDINDTNYYLNPASTSNLGIVKANSTASGTEALTVDGVNGRLFTITDDLSNSLFSVNTIAGLPVMEAFSDYRVILGRYNQYDLHINSSGQVAMGTSTATTNYKLTVSGSIVVTPTGAWNAATPALNVGGTGDGRIQVRHIYGKSSASASADHLWLQYQNTGNHVQIGDSGGGNNLYVSGNIYMGGYFSGNLVATQTWVQSQGYLTSYTETDPYRVTTVSVTGTSTKTITLTRADSSTVTTTWTDYDTDTNTYTSSASFNTGNGIVTFTRNDSTTYTVNLDGRYLTSYSETDTLNSVTTRGNTTANAITVGAVTIESGTSGTTGKLIFKTSDNADLNKYIMQDSYWTLVGTHSNEGFRVRDSASNILMSVNGSTNAYPSRVAIGNTTPAYKLHVSGDIYADGGWLRVSGTSGLYFESYGGGWRMIDSTWIRSYGSKPVYIDSGLETATFMRIASNVDLYNSSTNTWNTAIERNGGDFLMYATVYYDKDNTAYYLNPASTSNLATVKLNSTANGSEVFTVDGINGRLFTITDDLSDSLFSVNTIAGVPVIEAFADSRVIMGRYNQNDLHISAAGLIGIGKVPSTYKVDINGNVMVRGGYAYYGEYGTWTGETNKIQWHSNNLYFQNTGGGEWIFRNSGGANVFRVNSSGEVNANGNIYGAYILGTYANFSSGNSENPTIGQIWTQNTSDNYLRKSTPAHFISQLSLITTSNIGSYALTSVPNLQSVTNVGASTTLGVTVGSLTVSKSGNNSTITFPAEQNDPGFITHYEANNTARMYFSVSDDDNGTNDYFQFGAGGTYRTTIYTNGRMDLTDVYLTGGGWFRAYGTSGLYSQDYGNHWYATDSATWNSAGNNASYNQIAMRTGGHQGPVRGYLYADNSNNIGILNNAGNWGIRLNSSRDTQLYGALTVGNGTSSDIYMTDTDETTRRIHCNSSRIGFLNSSSNWGSYSSNDGSWSSDQAMYAPIYYDISNTNYYLNPNGYSNLGTVRFNSSGSGAEVIVADGVNGRLFTITDDMTDSIFSVNTISGLPVIEAFADYTVVMGRYGLNDLKIDNAGAVTIRGNTVWHAGNDGASSGLDADLLDGQHGSYYYAASNPNGYITNTNNYYYVNAGAGYGVGFWNSAPTTYGITMATTASYGAINDNSEYYLYLSMLNGGGRGVAFRSDNGITFQVRGEGHLFNRGPIYPGYNNGGFGGQGSYYLYGDTGNSGVRTNGNFLVNSDIYFGSRSVWLTSYLNQAVLTTSSPTFTRVYTTQIGIEDSGIDCYMEIGDGNPTEDGIGYGGTFHFYGDKSVTASHLYFGGALIYNNLVVNGRITENSSIRYKKDVTQIENGLEKVLQLSGVTYTKINNEQREAGVIAEEVAKILPEAVGFDTEGRPDSVSYGRLTALLIEAIKDLKKEIDELKGNK